jgi:hypothetical protein
MPNQMSENQYLDEVYGDIISEYTRAQAIEDGVLIDLNQWIPVIESGYKYPVACTAGVFSIIRKAVENKYHCNDYNGVIWDILHMSRMYQTKKWTTGALFQVKIKGAEHKQLFTFKIECSGGDNAEPVLTVMLPDED